VVSGGISAALLIAFTIGYAVNGTTQAVFFVDPVVPRHRSIVIMHTYRYRQANTQF
jgi:predicted Co/Zn/Cd cation transporter (cation efflux family)